MPGPVPVRRAYKFRAYPTRPQDGRASRLLADHCDLYNAALQERREAWRMCQASISYGAQSAQLKEIRQADRDGHGRHSFTAQQQTLRRRRRCIRPWQDTVVCPVHGLIDADVNGARNVYARAGLGSGQAPTLPEKLPATAVRTVT
jgi:transposase